MTEQSTFERASAHADPRPLAGIACCTGLSRAEVIDEPTELDLPAGHVLDQRFSMVGVIGRSGTSTIYLARDLRAGSSVAVKVPKPSIESDPVSYGRFQREEIIGLKLDHPALLKFIPAPGQRIRPYIVTEFLDGCTLTWVMRRVCPLPEADALRIAAAVCDALGHMHSRGFIHRDLKPDNIMVCADGRLCIMDFGLAEEIDAGAGFLAGLRPLFGTPEYMAPEQVANRRNDQRTDIYCLGVILYEMLTGRLPFEAEDVWSAAHLRVSGDPCALRTINELVSPEAEELVLRAMSRDPRERHQSVLELRDELTSPERVKVTGRSQRLRAPRWRLSLQGTPILSGIIMGVASLTFMVGLFLVLMRHR